MATEDRLQGQVLRRNFFPKRWPNLTHLLVSSTIFRFNLFQLFQQSLTTYREKLNGRLMEDLRILKKQDKGQEQCLITLKKFVIPKIYGSLFPLYVHKVRSAEIGVCTYRCLPHTSIQNERRDKRLYEKIELLKPIVTPETLEINRKFRLDSRSIPYPTPSSTLATTATSPSVYVFYLRHNNPMTCDQASSTA